jgi:threonine/homoserine/homoserine lactone efflux protein
MADENSRSGRSRSRGHHASTRPSCVSIGLFACDRRAGTGGRSSIGARIVPQGKDGILAFIAGLVVGDLTWFVLAAMGMAAIAQRGHNVFIVLKCAGVAYLLYLAFRSLIAPATPISIQDGQLSQHPLQLFLGSLTLNLSNPKVMIFFLALLPTIVDVAKLRPADLIRLAVAICVILSSVLGLYVVLALRTRLFFKSSRAVHWLNCATGVVMIGATIAVATR